MQQMIEDIQDILCELEDRDGVGFALIVTADEVKLVDAETDDDYYTEMSTVCDVLERGR